MNVANACQVLDQSQSLVQLDVNNPESDHDNFREACRLIKDVDEVEISDVKGSADDSSLLPI